MTRDQYGRTIITFDFVTSPTDRGWSWNVRKSSAEGVSFALGSEITRTRWGMRRKVAKFVRKTIKAEVYAS